MPPSSRGPGHDPFKVKTGVRISVGAQVFENRSTDKVERFLSLLLFENRGKLDNLGLEIDTNILEFGN